MVINGVAILNNERFLEKSKLLMRWGTDGALIRASFERVWRPCSNGLQKNLHAGGWGFSQMRESNSLKMSIIGGIHAVQYFRSKWTGEGVAWLKGGVALRAPQKWHVQSGPQGTHGIVACMQPGVHVLP